MAARVMLTLAAVLGLAAADGATEQATNPTCYDDYEPRCYGVSRDLSVTAISWYCHRVANMIVQPGASPFNLNYTYTTNKFESISRNGAIAEEGIVKLVISRIAADGCANTAYTISYDSCFSSMMAPVDRCDTDSENGKHGGFLDAACLRWEFQPNPLYWPECRYYDCVRKHRSGLTGVTCGPGGSKVAMMDLT